MKTLRNPVRGRERSRPFLILIAFGIALALIAAPANAQTNLPGLNSPQAAPDLVTTDIWSSGSSICYQVFNNSADSATSFTNGLRVGGNPVATQPVSGLGPLGRWNDCFQYTWTCGSPEDTILVGADIYQEVAESNETNNSRSETWNCDQVPPTIQEGPDVSNITTTGAKISWHTDESSDSQVLYDEKLNTFGFSKANGQPVTQHEIQLSGLKPGTLYQFKVRSSDASGNEVESAPEFFETLPEKDTIPPDISDKSVERLAGDFISYRLSAKVEDNDQVERVEFYMDDKLLGTDYSPAPDDGTTFEWVFRLGYIGMDQVEFDADHEFRYEAYDRSGISQINKVSYHPSDFILNGELAFLSPDPDYVHYVSGYIVPSGTIIPISVHASEYYEHCDFFHPGCTRTEEPVDSVEIFIDGEQVPAGDISQVDDLTYTYDWDIGGLGLSSHTLRAISRSGGLARSGTQTMQIKHGFSSLDVERSLTQEGHLLRVDLRIENNGTWDADLNNLTDYLVGFQPIIKTSTYYTVTIEYGNPLARIYNVNIDLHSGSNPTYTLEPSHHLDVSYLVAPVLYQDIFPVDYAVGADPLELTYNTLLVESFDRPAYTTTAGDSLLAVIEQIQQDSDYLIVTNPWNLFGISTDGTNVENLLSALAELADVKNGILAHLIIHPTADEVDDAIEAWGSTMKGSDGVDEHYLTNGYLLLVGETDVIPAHSKRLEPPWYASWADPMTIDPTDLYYADTSGNVIDPELAVGRIIGNTPARLLIPIQTAIGLTNDSPGYSFDWEDALVVGGWPETRAGGAAHGDVAAFTSAVESRLEDHGTDVFVLDTTDYISREIASDVFFAMAPDKGIIHWTGHGTATRMDDIWVTDFDDHDDPFDHTNPFIFSTACSGGDYTTGRGLAETTLMKGAGVFLGSTETTGIEESLNAVRMLYDDWDPGDTVGQALKLVKRDLGGYHAGDLSMGYYEDIWTAEYHLFGDPEFGEGAAAPVSRPVSTKLQPTSAPLSSIQVSVPEYQVEKTDLGKDRVVIPGGSFVMMPGEPMVPKYDIVQAIPAGTVIQEVTLSQRSGLKTEEGLDLEPFAPGEFGKAKLPAQPLAESEWFPGVDFAWGVISNPDGTSELHIILYPFFYNSLTQKGKFYTSYNFTVSTSSTSLTIPLLDTDQPVYDPGDLVLVDLAVDNSGKAQTVTLSAAVYALGSYELVDGLLMETLHNLIGPATASLVWDSSKAPVGDYFILAELRDLQGNLLASESEPISLGRYAGQAADLEAPNFFKIGDLLSLSFDFQNTGTQPITGTARIRVEGMLSGSLSEFQIPVDNLQPNATQNIQASWDSSGENLEDFQVTAYVLFEGQTTPALTRVMQTTLKIYLPIVRR